MLKSPVILPNFIGNSHCEDDIHFWHESNITTGIFTSVEATRLCENKS